jgi:hypothetical protein
MLNRFRHANNLNGAKHDELFIHRSELVSERLGADDTVVFVDDFSGTGDQVCNGWNEIFSELLVGDPRVYLVLVAASTKALARVQSETDLIPVVQHEIRRSDSVFESGYFTEAEKSVIKDYCTIAEPARPMGHGDCGFVLVFAHTCPNNTIPILHASRSQWEGLFRRYD